MKKQDETQPDFTKEFILTTDASENAFGGILSQKDDNGMDTMVVAYSKTLDNTQKNYSVTDKELLACVKCMQFFRKYLIGRQFKLRTDHKAIQYMKDTKNDNARLFRWAIKLSDYDYEIEYVKGEKKWSRWFIKIR